jgi:hypothetical protein
MPGGIVGMSGGALPNADHPALGTYRAFFYSNERGEPPHIRVQAGSSEAKFWLHDLTVADLPPMKSALLSVT